MKKVVVVIAVLLMTLMMFLGCSSDKKSSAPSLVVGTLITEPSFTPVTVIPQFIATTDGAVAPGMANYWDLYSDFSIDDGSDDQFDGFLVLSVLTPTTTEYFPADQVSSELTYYNPVMGAADGAMVVSVSSDTTSGYSTITGAYSAFLYPTGNSILKQTVSLATATGTVTLNYSLNGGAGGGIIFGGPDTFRLVVRNSAGTELEELLAVTGASATSGSADFTAYRGQTIVLSFEHNGQWMPIVVDDVSITDSAATEFMTNGGFETGALSPWTTNTPKMYTNIISGTRNLDGLDVTRSFYTVPNKLWGRWVDVFSNPTGSDITTTVYYDNNLGSDGGGIIYSTPSTSNRAFTSWDGNASDRDIGFVSGLATSVTFTSASALALPTNDGTDDWIYTTYDITVPAGGKVAIVNFIIMSGTDTGQTAVDITATADEIDTVAAAIVANFWTDSQYRNGMTQAQIDAISNF